MSSTYKPLPGGLLWGAGLAQGANNFLQAYMSVRQQDHAEKLQQNAGLINIIMDRLHDENLSFDDRAKALDLIPGLLGIKKMDRPLSHELGLTPEFLKSTAVQGETKHIVNPLPTPQGVTEEGRPTLEQFNSPTGTGFTTDVVSPTVTQGQMTPYAIKMKQALEEKRQELNFKKQEIDYTNKSQFESLKALGWEEQSTGVDGQGNPLLIMKNKAGELKAVPMPAGYVPDLIRKAQITAGGKWSKTLGERFEFYKGRINPQTNQPYTEDEAETAAKNDLDTLWQANLKSKQLGAGIKQQQYGGTQPISPSQKVDDARARAEMFARLDNEIASASRQATKAQADAIASSQAADDYVKKVINPQKDSINAFYKEIGQNPEAPVLSDMTTEQQKKAEGLKDDLDKMYTNYYNNLEPARTKNNSAWESLKEAEQKARDTKRDTLKNLGIAAETPQNIGEPPPAPKIKPKKVGATKTTPTTTPAKVASPQQQSPAMIIQKNMQRPDIQALINAARKKYATGPFSYINDPKDKRYMSDQDLYLELVNQNKVHK